MKIVVEIHKNQAVVGRSLESLRAPGAWCPGVVVRHHTVGPPVSYATEPYVKRNMPASSKAVMGAVREHSLNSLCILVVSRTHKSMKHIQTSGTFFSPPVVHFWRL